MFSKILHTYWTKLLATGFVFLAVVLTSRYLGTEGKGLTSLISTNLLFICLANEFVGGVALIYLIPRRKPVALLIPAVAFTLLDSLLLAAFFHALDIIPKEYSIHLYFLAVLQTLNNTVLYVLLGKEDVKQHNYLFLLKTFVNVVVLALFFILFKNATVGAFINALYVSNVVPLVIGCALILPYLKGNIESNDMAAVAKEMFSYSGFAQLANIIQTLNYRLSFYLLSLFIGQGAVGIYSVALALCDVIWMLSKSIGTVQLTRIANTEDAVDAHELTRKLLRFSVLSTLALLIPAMLIPENVYSFVFGADFGDIRIVILTMSAGIFIFSINIILSNHFGGTGRYKINMMASLLGLAVNVAANILLIPRYGLPGAGIAASLTYAVITFYTWWRFSKESTINWKDLVVGKQDLRKIAEVMGWGREI